MIDGGLVSSAAQKQHQQSSGWERRTSGGHAARPTLHTTEMALPFDPTNECTITGGLMLYVVIRTHDGATKPCIPLFLRTILGPDYY